METIGSIGIFQGMANCVSSDFMPCDGRQLLTEDYSDLYGSIGNTYGGDEGMFQLPTIDTGNDLFIAIIRVL